MLAGVVHEGNAGIAALLGAVVHQAVFANVEVASARPTAPIIGQTLGNVVLKCVNAREAAFLERLHLVINAALFSAERLELPAVVVNDPNRRREAEFDGALADDEGVLWVSDAAADHRVDIHVKVGVFSEQLQFSVENFQTLLGDFVGIDVVDRDLQPFQAGTVEALDTLGDQEVSVCDQAGDHDVRPDAANHIVEFGMHERFASRDGDDGSSESTQLVDAAVHLVDWHRFGEIVKLVAVSTGQVAAAHGNDVCQERVVGGCEGTHSHLRATQIAVRGKSFTPDRCEYGGHDGDSSLLQHTES